MARVFSTLSDVQSHGFDTVIDVRSPAEYAVDHLPGAINLPVLGDEERARVGTIYKQESPFQARKIGAALVARNAAAHIEGPLADKDGGWRPLVYCWRGGQRSGAFASILKDIGWRAEKVAGGYQSYRRLVAAALYEAPFQGRIVLLDGNTGTGKTEVLGRLAGQGIQVIDLEGLAGHRGSVLGAIGDQPSQKAFESALAAALAGCDPERPVVVEAESSKIGRLLVPPKLFEAMRAAPRIEIRAPVAERAGLLARAYGGSVEELADRIGLLRSLRGTAEVESWAGLVRVGELEAAARALIEGHYDPAYAKSRGRATGAAREVIKASRLDEAGLDALATEVARAVSGL